MASRSVSVTPSAHRLAALSPLSILLLVVIIAQLVGTHGGLQIGKQAVHDEQAPWNDSYVAYITKLSK